MKWAVPGTPLSADELARAHEWLDRKHVRCVDCRGLIDNWRGIGRCGGWQPAFRLIGWDDRAHIYELLCPGVEP